MNLSEMEVESRLCWETGVRAEATPVGRPSHVVSRQVDLQLIPVTEFLLAVATADPLL